MNESLQKPENTAASVNTSLVRVARCEELQGNGPFAVSARGRDLVVVRTKLGLRAFEGRCPHQGALLGEGELDGETLVCRNHRWRFSTDTGQRKDGPQCLASCHVVEQGGEVLVDLSTLAKQEEPKQSVATRSVGELPGPAGLPLLGNVLQLKRGGVHLVLESWARQYGPIYRFRTGPHQIVAVSAPELCEHVLRKRPELFRRVSNIETLFEEMGTAGVFSAEGTAWRPQRRLAMQALSHDHLRDFYPTLKTIAERLNRRWEATADRGTVVDIVEDLKRFTVDVTTLLAFGHDVNTIEQSNDVIQRRLELIFPALSRRLFALIPTWRYFRLPADRRLDRALNEIQVWLRKLMETTRARVNASPAQSQKPSNFLQAMLLARNEAGRPFSDDVILGNLMTMLVAGEDTTAFTLGWAVHHLCDSPASVAGLRKEADALLGTSPTPADIETANKLVWAGAVANETMRLRPVAPVLIHETNTDTVLGDVRLPARTRIALLTRPAARESNHFADSYSFRPERWLGGIAGTHEPSMSIPFGSGPRICPGRSLALLEMKVVLATLYKNFDVQRVGSAGGVREVFAFTMHPSGLSVRLRRRK